MTKRILLPVNTTDDYANRMGCDLVLVTLDQNRLASLREYYDKCKPLFKEKGFHCVEWFDCDFEILSEDTMLNEEWYVNEGISIAPESFSLENAISGAAEFKIDTHIIRISSRGVLWRFYQKHTTTEYATDRLPWEMALDTGTREKR